MTNYCKLLDGPCAEEDCETCPELNRRQQPFMCEYNSIIICPYPKSDCMFCKLLPEDEQ